MTSILFFTGLRAGELRSFTRRTLLDLIENGEVEILQTKTNAKRTVIFSENARYMLKTQLKSIYAVCEYEDTPLYPFQDPQGNKLIESINAGLEPYAEKLNLKFSSHSFRAGYITQLLREVPAQHVQELVGHADIRSTMQYNRLPLSTNAKRKLLDQAYVTLDLPEESQNNQESKPSSQGSLEL